MTFYHDLQPELQAYLSADAGQFRKTFGTLVARLKEALAAGQFEEAAAVLRRAVLPTLDYTSAQTLYRMYKRLRGRIAEPARAARLAVLSSFTSKQLTELIELHLFALRVEADVYEADYGVFRHLPGPLRGLRSSPPRRP